MLHRNFNRECAFKKKCKYCIYFKSKNSVCVDNVGFHYCLKNLNMVNADMCCSNFEEISKEFDYES